jgi:hypothetical protein
MLKAIELENFKAFGERCRVEFAPITLIFGENSAGKSSILQSLHLLKQTRDNRDAEVLLLPRVENGYVELGSFEDFVFDHDPKRTISIRVDMQSNESSAKLEPKTPSDEDENRFTGFEIRFFQPLGTLDIGLESIRLHSSNSADPIAEFQTTQLGGKELAELRRDLRISATSLRSTSFHQVVKCSDLTVEPIVWQEVFQRTHRRRQQIADELRLLRSESVDYETARGEQRLLFETDEEKEAWLSEVDRAIDFYDRDFTSSDFIERMKPVELDTVMAMDGFIPLQSRRRSWGGLPELETFRRYGPTRIRLRDLTLNLASIAADCGHSIEQEMKSLYPLGPFRKLPQRLYTLQANHSLDVGYDGKSLPDLLFRNPDVIETVNQWLDKLEIGYHVQVESVGEASRGLYELRLLDRRRSGNVTVAISDVGFGISQVLPLIVQCLAGKKQTITIEQPEVHIHPRLQADLGDLLADSIAAPRAHSFIIETHSEHLMLRMQRLIRERRIRPADVSVLYVRRGNNGSTVERLHLDEDGDFLDDWPGGFFPERLKELL